VVFLHEVRRGAADRSYGVQVARLAGLPARVVERARAILQRLESGGAREARAVEALVRDLPLFSAVPAVAPTRAERPQGPSAVESRLAAISPDDLSPREALAVLYELKRIAGESGAV
jgi:DNA mismatch repair protein MutS